MVVLTIRGGASTSALPTSKLHRHFTSPDCCSDRMEGAVIYSLTLTPTTLQYFQCLVAHLLMLLEAWRLLIMARVRLRVGTSLWYSYTGRILQMCGRSVRHQPRSSLVDGDTMTMWLNAVPAWIEADLSHPGDRIQYTKWSVSGLCKRLPIIGCLRGSDDQSADLDGCACGEQSRLVCG